MNARVFENGYNVLTEQDGAHKNALMDIGVYVFQPGERSKFLDESNEAAFLLLGGEIIIEWQEKTVRVARHSVFEERPTTLHVPRGMEVWIKSPAVAEVLIQKTGNTNDFAPVFYKASSVKDVFLGEDNMQGCAKRILRDIFNYNNAPYSNMVLGEDIHLPGRWSSYPPHHHPQPEVYYYKFNKPQGFGVSIIGDDATVIMDNHFSVIPGGLCHPQVTAPGYEMYYVWMIRHLDGNPWTDRVDDPAHSWLHDKEAVIWNGPAYRDVI